MEWFESKKALLEHLGKNVKDNKLVDRMLLDWRVELREWMYYVVDKDEIIRELRAEIEELKKSEQPNELNFKQTAQILENSDEIDKLKEKARGLESDLEFQISENERLEAKVKRCQDSIRNSYYYINDTLHKKVNRPDYKAIIKLEWTLPWEDNQ